MTNDGSAPAESGGDVPAKAVVPAPGVGVSPGLDPFDGVERPLDPRALPLERSVCWIVTAVVCGGSAVVLVPLVLLGALPDRLELLLAAGWLLVTALFSWWARCWPPLWHRHSAWSVDATGLLIRHGVWWRHVLRVPRSRVQHTDVTQGPLERRHGLGTLVVHTAGTEHARVPLRGLDHALALALRDHLLPRGSGDAV